jgi:hypothetical protein
MKTKQTLKCLTIILGLIGTLGATPASATKIALIVAIGDYPEASDWSKINAINDIALIRSALLQQGFTPDNIFERRNSEATRKGIIDAISITLLAKAKPGDIVLFHFSGHGQQIKDDNGDEVDGYDEAIVPYDSPLAFQKGVYEGENLIRDDKLGRLFDQIRKKIGKKGQLIVLLDSCHSGTGTRGLACARGTDLKMADSAWVRQYALRAEQNEEKQLSEVNTDKLAPMVAFFGASARQLNYETEDENGQPIGALSYAFSRSLSRLKTGATYRGLFEQIRNEMAATSSRQTPQAEGALEHLVLKDDRVEQSPFFRVKSFLTDGSVLVDGGWLQGMNEGSEVGFFPPETHSASIVKPWLKGRIVQSMPLKCFVLPDSSAERPDGMSSAWVMMLHQSPGYLGAKLHFRLRDKMLKSSLISAFQDQPLIQLFDLTDSSARFSKSYSEARASIHLFLIQDEDTLELLNEEEQPLASFDLKANEKRLLATIFKEVKKACQINIFRKLEAPASVLDVSMKMIPVLLDENQNTVKILNLEEFTDEGGALHLPEGTNIKISVSNAGKTPAYFTMIDIEPLNQFNIIVPAENSTQTPEEFQIKPGETLEIPGSFAISKPYGLETFKLIATDRPADLRSIKATSGGLKRGPALSTPLEILFSDTFFSEAVQSRGGQLPSMPPASIGVFTLRFWIEASGK